MTALLQARDLAVIRGDAVLFSKLDFELHEGEVLQLQGANGAGKTTLLRALCTLVPLDAGQIQWRGKPLPAAREAYFEEMLYLSHSDSVNNELTAVENLRFASRMANSESESPVVLDEQIDSALHRVGLQHRKALPARVLSAGQRRRVGLARLLATSAALWLMDEPLTALDVNGRELVESLISEHVGAGGSVVFTTHQPLPLANCEVRTVSIGA